MKQLSKKLCTALLAVLLLISMSLTAFAAQTVSIDGYEGAQDPSQLTISNVVQREAQDYWEGVPTFVCNAPAVVTSTVELYELDVSPITVVEDGWELGDSLSIDGYCDVYDDSFAVTTMPWKEAHADARYIISSYKSGAKITIDKPGTYYVIGRYEALAGAAEAIIIIKGSSAPTEAKATPTNAKVLVNGTFTAFDAYNINGNNYFKLRDLAKVVNGTKKQFEVTWDGSKNAIDLVSGKAYSPVGGELSKGDGIEKMAKLTNSDIYKNGVLISLTAYNINGNNYFKLRDIAQAFDIGLVWNPQTATIGIDTTLSYTAE